MIDPEDDGGSECDGGHEGVCASVVAGVDAPPVLEAAEHVLNLVATPVESGIMWDRCLTTFAGGDAGSGAACGKRLANQSAS